MKYLIDIDGTLLNGSQAINGSINFIKKLNSNDYLLMTNSIKSREVQVKRLLDAGFNIDIEKILNPILAVNEYIRNRKLQKVKVIGSEEEIKQINVRNVFDDYELVVLLDFEKSNFGYGVLQQLVLDIEDKIEVITASRSLYYLKNNRRVIDTGSFVRLLEDITDYKIRNFGKPAEAYFEIAKSILQETKEDIIVIGDDWNTDIVGANNSGFKSILVRSGKYQLNDEDKCKPYKVVNRLDEI